MTEIKKEAPGQSKVSKNEALAVAGAGAIVGVLFAALIGDEGTQNLANAITTLYVTAAGYLVWKKKGSQIKSFLNGVLDAALPEVKKAEAK